MICGILFSGGKDSTLALYLTKKHGYKIGCLISLFSSNPESYMFHTPIISNIVKQADVMDYPIITQNTKGKKEKELTDLEFAIKKAKDTYNIDAVVSGAIESTYQASRIQKICNKIDLECFNPLWQRNQLDLLDDIIKSNFKVLISGVFAYPMDMSWIGRLIDEDFVRDIKELHNKFKINPAGEGGEYETFVVYCPLFKKELSIEDYKIIGKGNSWKMEL
jgi:ABC transporter with metal-binding/Fe-S-binding domain ATP-binding protein